MPSRPPRAFTRLEADLLAAAAVAGPWTRSGLEERLGEAGAADPVLLARRVLDLMPGEPIEGESTVRNVLAELPELPARPVEVTVESSLWKFDVPRWQTPHALCQAFDLTMPELEWFADVQGRLRGKPGRLHHYRYHNGARLIEAPKVRLREVQRRILRKVLDRLPVHAAAHGFRRGRSVHTFGSGHAGADLVVRIDLRWFFSTITAARVRAVFLAVGYPPSVASLLAGLCTTATPVPILRGMPFEQATLLRTRHLPQGAPTSPALANMVARNLDRRLAGLAQSQGLYYTRYADDLAFSGDVVNVEQLLWTVGAIVRDEGFFVHPSKTKVMRAHHRQRLAGLVVNAHPQASRDDYEALKALLYNCVRYGPASQNRDGRTHFREHVSGHIAWVGESNSRRREKLRRLEQRIVWS
ncbi:reverse transcriptase family protein [Hoyosella altamirensis]|uniref:RNA-directed DNA polymerase n=1 Tax=Hoyosella altamirensis TaxID=616997 RepID=A0A839RRB9_9ACTN|nr:reverse transcriptase family protein [Hoyosella altamirensis]MBB3038646.1 hypothetical protein [Hoyosella altamirensis]